MVDINAHGLRLKMLLITPADVPAYDPDTRGYCGRTHSPKLPERSDSSFSNVVTLKFPRKTL